METPPSLVLRHLPLGRGPWKTFEPFLFCVHHCDHYPAGNQQMAPQESLAGRNIGSDFSGLNGWSMYHGNQIPGFPQHPHRGFETISIIRQGLIDHSDSLGATARIGAGDVQWMTAGSGIVHAEMFPLVHQDQKNPTDFFQLWLNLPAVNKMAPPQFKMFWNEEIPRATYTDQKGKRATVTVIAGSFKELKPLTPPSDSWASKHKANVAIWLINLEPNAEITLPSQPEGCKRAIYHVDGSRVNLGGTSLHPEHGALMRANYEHPIQGGSQPTSLLVLQARPIGEAVVQHGPFVMNSSHEIRQAIYDYQRTRFGGWPWTKPDPAHPRVKGRFARFADGKEIQPPSTHRK